MTNIKNIALSALLAIFLLASFGARADDIASVTIDNQSNYSIRVFFMGTEGYISCKHSSEDVGPEQTLTVPFDFSDENIFCKSQITTAAQASDIWYYCPHSDYDSCSFDTSGGAMQVKYDILSTGRLSCKRVE